MIAAYLIALTSATLGQSTSVTYADTFTAGQYPARVAADGGGGIYVTDPTTNQVIQLDAVGAPAGTFAIPETPVGIARHNGNIYVSRADGVVGIYDAAFVLQGTLNPESVVMVAPNDVAVHPLTGEVYVVDAGGYALDAGDELVAVGHQVVVFDGTTGLLVRSWGMPGSGLSEFMTPQSIAIDAALDHVIVTDTDNFRVQVFDTTGILQFKFGYRILFTTGGEVGWFTRVEGVAVDSCSNIYIADALMGTVRAFDALGVELDPTHAPVINYGTAAGELRVPNDIMIDTADRMYVSSYNNASVEVYDLDCTPAVAPATASANRAEAKRDRLRGRAAKAKHVDNPYDIITAMADGEAPRALDLNNDRRVDLLDLEEAVKQFDGATLEQFLLGMNANVATPGSYQLPHMIDIDNLCGRCHSVDGLPEGMLTAAGQENLCLSCHQGGGIAKNTKKAGTGKNNSHPWGIAADTGDVAGPDPESIADLDLHLDGGNIRCGTCHNPHVSTDGSPLLRASVETGALCMECHRGVGAQKIHAVGTEHGPRYCSDCHDMHATGDNPELVKESLYSWYNGGMVSVGFADHSLAVGAGGFVDPAPGAYGICDVCHQYFDDSVDPPVVSAEFQALVVPHTDTMDLCTNCHAHENGFMPGLSEEVLAALGSTGKWAGVAACQICHTEKHTDWMTTNHEEAWDDLDGIGQGANAFCLGCHTVGFGDPDLDGFIDDATTPHFEGVQCENCHGAAAAHAQDVLHVHPPQNPRDSAVCGGCHTGSHNPTFEEWGSSHHAISAEDGHYSSCSACHAPLGENPATGHNFSVECAACHNPHVQTGNAAAPEPGHDYQLRYPEVAFPTPSNLIADCTDPARFNLCGQCHHSRGRTWDATSRGPHHSLQSNVYFGEMPMPAGEEATPLVPNTASDHAGLGLQCVQCHMHKAPHEDGPPEVAAITGHSWAINYEACAPCHTSAANAQALAEGHKAVVEARLAGIVAALGDPSTWEYSSAGGPPSGSPGQDDISDDIKKVRFLVAYIDGDGSHGVHNSAYVSLMLDECESLLGIGSGDPVYLGAEACGACHDATHAEWEGTLHSEAWDALDAIGNGANAYCLGCHTVGFGETNGYVDDATTSYLGGVQCENCHGSGMFHVLNPHEPTTQPFPSLAAELCGGCHTGSHNPNFEEWSTSAHSTSYTHSHGSSCNACHAPLRADPHIASDAELGVECAVCHDPHAQTGNAIAAVPPADYQLRFPQATPGTTVPSNFVADATDPTRFNLCGQCHHSRGRTWDATSRGPHHSLQSNVLLGEMPMPAGEEATPLVANMPGSHRLADRECATCHMEMAPHEDGPPEVDAIKGHTWQMTTGGCNSEPGCHVSVLLAEIALVNLQALVLGELADLETRLGDPMYWQYSSAGGPPGGTPGQDEVPDEVKKARFLMAYVEGDASHGGHNPGYVVAMLLEANALLDSYIGGGGTWPPAAAWWGACCDGASVCTDQVTEADCTAGGGTWYEAGDCTADEDDDGFPDFTCP